MKTYQPKKREIKRSWHLLDAKDQILGRLAAKTSQLLMGKHKVSYSTHMDSGDNVVIINCEKVKLSGKKNESKIYVSHSGYPGGYKETKIQKLRKENPERILEKAIYGMLPANRLRSNRMNRLFLIKGDKNKYENKFK